MKGRDIQHFMCLFSLALLFTNCGGFDTNGPQSSARQHILIEGSNALQPFISAIVPNFEKQYLPVTAKVKGGGSAIESRVNIQVQGGGSVPGLNSITQQKADISMTDIYANPATYSSPQLTDQIVAVIPYALIINPDLAAIQSLTTQQVIEIFSTHTIHNWAELGGPNLPVIPISEDDNIKTQGNADFFQTTVLGGNSEMGTPVDEDSGATTLDIVARTPGAIGYSAVPLIHARVQTIAIDGKNPTANNIESNRYHFWVYGHLYTLKSTDSNITAFFNYALTPAAQQVAQNLGYIPLARMKILT